MAGNYYDNPNPQFLDANGDPFSGGKLEFFEAGSTTVDRDTFTDTALTVANVNPIILDSSGRSPTNIFLQQLSYNVRLLDSSDVLIWARDNVSNITQIDVAGVAAVDTYALLTVILKATLTDGDFRQVNGRTTRGDIGSVFFEFVSGDSSTANGGTILATDEGGTGRWFLRFNGAANVKWFGTDITAFKNAFTAHKEVDIPGETFTLDNSSGAITEIQSGATVTLADAAELLFTSILAEGIDINTKTGIVMRGGQVTGAGGNAPSFPVFVLDSSTNCKIDDVEISESPGIGLRSLSNTGCTISNCHAHDNFHYGIEDKLGTANQIVFNNLSNNGANASATSTFGRGITVWQCSDGEYSFNIIKNNNEYGLRFFSEVGDPSPCENNRAIGNHCEANGDGSGGIEIFIVGASGTMQRNLFANNTVIVTGTESVQGIALQGIENVASDNIIVRKADNQTNIGVLLFEATNCVIQSNTFRGFASAITMSAATKPSGIRIIDNDAIEVAEFITQYETLASGDGHEVRGNRATHGGAGATDTGVNINTQVDGKHIFADNFFDDFNRGLEVADSDVLISRNKTINSDDVGCRINGTATDDLIFENNDWDSSLPQSFCGAFAVPGSTLGRRMTFSNQIPSSDSQAATWKVGDYVNNNNMTPDGNDRLIRGWRCTVAGAPGTWSDDFTSNTTFA